MWRRFPLFTFVMVAITGTAATLLACYMNLPVTWTEWIDTGSGRVIYVREIMDIEVSREQADSPLAKAYLRYGGEPGPATWVALRYYESAPDYLQALGYRSTGSPSDEGADYLAGSIALNMLTDLSGMDSEDRERMLEVMAKRYTRDCHREIIHNCLELVRLTGSVQPAVDYSVDVFALEQSTREPLTPRDLPDIEEYGQRWNNGGRP